MLDLVAIIPHDVRGLFAGWADEWEPICGWVAEQWLHEGSGDFGAVVEKSMSFQELEQTQ